MRRTFWVLACSGLLATSAAAWAGCYQLSSDCGLLLTCGGNGGAATTSSSSSSSSSTSTNGTGGMTTTTGTGGTGKDAGPVCHVDGIKDGTETDIDCGGPACPPCAKGKTCAASTDCATAGCVESICCGSATCPSCASCAIPGKEGTCTDLPKGTDQPAVCQSAGICDVGGTCTGADSDAGTNLPFRAPCTQAGNCFNGVCQAGFCKLALGDACGSDAACGSGRCAGNVCAACASGADCASTHCNAGVCAMPGGAPCKANADCASQFCTNFKFCIATASETCTPANCLDHFCKGGNCQSCSTASDCPLNTPCSSGGECLTPPGAFCNQSSECASGTCAPAALLDFRRCQ